jgi:hypothetical protein
MFPMVLSFLALGMLAVGALLAMFGSPPPDAAAPAQGMEMESAQDTAQRLQGTWLREQAAEGFKSRHLLVLEADGTFRENVRVTDQAGAVTDFVHAGTWLYDGTNLKRKYTLMNGKPPSRLNLPFATFEIRFESRNAFRGIDHIHGNRIEYQRVGPQTQP